MAIRTRHEVTENTWFITFTCYNWLPLFDATNSHDLVYKWLNLIDNKHQIKTLAFVIMPNHVHLLLHITNLNVNLNTIISNAKRFIAYELIERLNKQQNYQLLNALSSACTEKERMKDNCIKLLNHRLMQNRFTRSIFYTRNWITSTITRLVENGN